jgi:3-methyl-2-oxobutanoate hydroxymethyltransferase
VKRYADLGDETVKAFTAYAEDVRARRFPEPQHTYSMVEGEFPKLKASLKRRNKGK